MASSTSIVDPDSNHSAKVTEFGQLIVAPIDYSTAVEREMDTPGVAFNFLTPEHGKSIVITDIIASANKDVSSTTPADIPIFQAGSAISAVSLGDIVRPQLARAQNIALIGLNLLVPEGMWVNATTDDATILLTIMYYRVPV